MLHHATVTLRSGARAALTYGFEPGHRGHRHDPDSVEPPYCIVSRAVVDGAEVRVSTIRQEVREDHWPAMMALARDAEEADWHRCCAEARAC